MGRKLTNDQLKNYRFLTFNVRSLLNKEKRKFFANLINCLCIDILFITETWLLESMNENELYLDNYEFYRSARRGKNHLSAHGGVLVGIKKEFHTWEVDFQTNVIGDISGCSLHIYDKNILRYSFYNPPTKSDYHINQDTGTSLFLNFSTFQIWFLHCLRYFQHRRKRLWLEWLFIRRYVHSEFPRLDCWKWYFTDCWLPTAASGILDIVLISKNLDNNCCEKANDQVNNLSNHFGVVSCVQFKSSLT